jgi:hypothetical protein
MKHTFPCCRIILLLSPLDCNHTPSSTHREESLRKQKDLLFLQFYPPHTSAKKILGRAFSFLGIHKLDLLCSVKIGRTVLYDLKGSGGKLLMRKNTFHN